MRGTEYQHAPRQDGDLFAGRRVAPDALTPTIVEIDPSFRLSSYAEIQPYKNPATREHLIETLRAAGLPE